MTTKSAPASKRRPASTRWSPRTRAKLIEQAAIHGSAHYAAQALGLAPETVYRWCKEHEGLKEELEVAYEKHIDSMASKARSILDRQLTRMEKGEADFDLPTVTRTMTRQDIRWSQQYRQKDVSVKADIAIQSALDELDAQSKTMSEGN